MGVAGQEVSAHLGEAPHPALLTASSLLCTVPSPHSLPAPGQAHAGRLRSSHSSQDEVMRQRGVAALVWCGLQGEQAVIIQCVCVCVQPCTCVCVCMPRAGVHRGGVCRWSVFVCMHRRGMCACAAPAGGHHASPRWGGAPLQHPGVQPKAAEHSKPHTGPQPLARGKYLPSVLPHSTG